MRSRLHQIVDRFPELSLAVLGDFLLDEFVFGEISRVSREAPVLILSYQESHVTPGGGANTVAGVASLGASVLPIGLLGGDSRGDRLLSCWPEKVDTRYVFRSPDRRTTCKSRILAGSFHSFRQQVVRIDYEHPHQLSDSEESELIRGLEAVIPGVDALIISDYSLGNVTRSTRESAVRTARRAGKPVVVDSRFDPSGFPGATSVTPNITELEGAIGSRIGRDLSALETIGMELRQKWQLEALLVTRGKLGMSLFTADAIEHIPIYGTDEVVDVTGAGDTVIATYTTALAAGATFREAAILANLAGGIVVTKRGTATVSREELREAVENSADQ